MRLTHRFTVKLQWYFNISIYKTYIFLYLASFSNIFLCSEFICPKELWIWQPGSERNSLPYFIHIHSQQNLSYWFWTKIIVWDFLESCLWFTKLFLEQLESLSQRQLLYSNKKSRLILLLLHKTWAKVLFWQGRSSRESISSPDENIHFLSTEPFHVNMARIRGTQQESEWKKTFLQLFVAMWPSDIWV